MNIFTRLLHYAGPYKSRLGLAFTLSIIGVLFELARPWPVKVVVDNVIGGEPLPASLNGIVDKLPGASSQQGLLVWSVAAAIVIVVAAAALSLFATYLTMRVSQHMLYDFSLEVFAKLQRLSLSYHARYPLGDLLQRVSNDVLVIYFLIAQIALPGIVSLLSLIGMFLIMASIDMTLALMALAVVPIIAVTLLIFSQPMQTTTSRQWASQAAFMSLAEQSLSNIKVVQGFARESYIQRKIEASASDLGNAYNGAIRVSAAYQQVTVAITGLGTAALLGIGGSMVLAGQLSLGDLLVFMGYLAALYGPVSALSTSVGYTVQIVSRGRRVFDILDSVEEVPQRPGAIELGRSCGQVQFEQVMFGYGCSEAEAPTVPVLRDISFQALPGEITAIVGATGAGKSSLISLLPRFYDPWEGRILVDGHDLRDLTLHSLRDNISLVLQDPFLFPISIADNIAFGRPDATREEIVDAARIAQASEFIERLPNGFDTVIEEKGTSLSGGQRQRIALARAILKDAPILILDEPTSALDARTESQIFEAVTHLMQGKTTFIISHRLTTIRRADRIVAIEDGRIAEIGTHEELLAKGEVYAQLYRHQHIAAM